MLDGLGFDVMVIIQIGGGSGAAVGGAPVGVIFLRLLCF